jgi:hypothetical protein
MKMARKRTRSQISKEAEGDIDKNEPSFQAEQGKAEDDWQRLYNAEHSKKKKPRNNIEFDPFNYPYRSSTKRKKVLVPSEFQLTEPVHDTHLKTLRKYYKPSFSPHFNSWIVDLVFGSRGNIYLFFINENTRYLVTYRVKSKSVPDITPAFMHFLNICGREHVDKQEGTTTELNDEDEYETEEWSIPEHEQDKTIRFKGDGEKSFASLANGLLNKDNIGCYFKENSEGTHFTYSYKVMDAVVRTIRNLLDNQSLFDDPEAVERTVWIYNHTPHSVFGNKWSPFDVQNDNELEAHFMRQWQEKANKANEKREMDGVNWLKEGNIVLVHYLKPMFKRRRDFDELATVVGWENKSNVIVELHLSGIKIIIPAFWCRYVAEDRNSIPYAYTRL